MRVLPRYGFADAFAYNPTDGAGGRSGRLEDGQQVRVRLREKAHSVFTRDGDDIVMHTKLSLKEVPAVADCEVGSVGNDD